MRAASSSTPTTSNGIRYTRKIEFVIAVFGVGRAEVDLVVAERVEQQAAEHDRDQHRRQQRPEAEVVVHRLGGVHRRLREHDAEQEQHDHRADVNEHLHPGDELRAEQDELRGAAREHDDEEQRRVHDVLRPHDADRAHRHRGRDDPEGHVLGNHGRTRSPAGYPPSPFGTLAAPHASADPRVLVTFVNARIYFLPLTSAPSSRGSGSGTDSIHSPRRSLSWSSDAMLGSEYSNSGLQNSASNGQTSTQMPQYMHSA